MFLLRTKVYAEGGDFVAMVSYLTPKHTRITHLEIFLVGGAVRDELLGRPIKERDWVVVGSTPNEMIAQGFQAVGKDFPVFLHPKTHEEYALARTERKTGKGYKGFHFYTTPDVTLSDDLMRRDLTINAMAKNIRTGEIIDPYHGKADIQQCVLRHVSLAFSEDPVRILRVARFAAQFPEFHVHPETMTLMQSMTQSGEVDALVSERVWKELSRALLSHHPERFFEVLKTCGALAILFPKINDSVNFSILRHAVVLSESGAVRFAALLATLAPETIHAMCDHYRVPSEYTQLALLVAKHQHRYHALDPHHAHSLWNILKLIDAFRRPERFHEWMIVCRIIDPTRDHSTVLLRAAAAAKAVDVTPLIEQGYRGSTFAEALKARQIEAIRGGHSR